MDPSFHTQDQVYEFWSLPLQEERNNVSNRRGRLSPLETQFNAASASLSCSPDPFFILDEWDSYPSSRSSPRHSTSSSLMDWNNSEPIQLPMPNTSSSSRRRNEPEKAALSPAQDRRRSQNRTAQRAFRERKERRIKELAAKIAKLEAESKFVGDENERLKKEITRLSNKNSTLRATNDYDDPDHYVEYSS